MIKYKQRFQPKKNIYSTSEQNNDDHEYTFVERLSFFLESFVIAVEQENCELLNELMQQSIEISSLKESSKLPSFCFNEQIAYSFIKSFQEEYYPSLFKYSIIIFNNIYISKYCSEINLFIPTGLLDTIWKSLSFINNDDITFVIHLVKEIMGQSKESWRHYHNLIKILDFLKITLKNVQESNYIDLLQEYIYYFTKERKFEIEERDAVYCYAIIYDIFKKFTKCLEKCDQSNENDEYIAFQKKTILNLSDSFKQMAFKDKYFYYRETFFKIVDNFFTYRFLIIDDFDIYACAIRVLSFLCDIEYKPVKEKYTDKKEHIEFQIIINREIDLYSKLLSDLNVFLYDDVGKIPPDSQYSDIPGHLCNIIAQFSIQINGVNFREKYLSKFGINYAFSFHQMMIQQSIYAFVDILTNGDVESKKNACKVVTLITDGPVGLVIQMLNLNVIPTVASFLESDDIKLIDQSLEFFMKLAKSCCYEFGYPIQSDMENSNLYYLIDQIIYSTDDDEEGRYKEISQKAEVTKKAILENIFQEDNQEKEEV